MRKSVWAPAIGTVAALSVLLAASFPAAATASQPPGPSPAATQQAAARMKALGVIQGRLMADGTVDLALDSPITRAELVTIMVRAFGMHEEAHLLQGTSEFADVPPEHWASGEIAVAKRLVAGNGHGLGYGAGFAPDRTVTHAEVVAFLVKFLGAKADNRYSWPGDYIHGAVNAGILPAEEASLVTTRANQPADRRIVFYLADQSFSSFVLPTVQGTLYRHFVDPEPPNLELDPAGPPADGIAQISGLIGDNTAVSHVQITNSANQQILRAQLSGNRFTADVPLVGGEEDVFTVTVTDLAGNQTTNTLRMEPEPEQGSGATPEPPPRSPPPSSPPPSSPPPSNPPPSNPPPNNPPPNNPPPSNPPPSSPPPSSPPPCNCAALAGPYADPRHAEVPFGLHSYYLTPWRAYMDTRAGADFLTFPATQFNNVEPSQAPAVARVLAESGIRHGRIETFPGQFEYDNPTRMEPSHRGRFVALLQAMKQAGIRPLIVLNANSAWPVPIKPVDVTVLADAPAGARSIQIDSSDLVKPGYTGFQGQDSYIGFPLITGCDGSGNCGLSAPLRQPVSAGALRLYTLKYQPFSGPVFAGGTPNPASGETVQGWMTFVATMASIAKEALGTEGAADAGFDLEVWNEYTLGSHFLSDRHYYEPAREYQEPLRYTEGSITVEGAEVILPLTANYVKDPSSGLPGVKVISGFSNQRPWESGDQLFANQTGYSRHSYTWYKSDYPGADESPGAQVNALGQVDNSGFVPSFTGAFPELWLTAYRTEFMRELSPLFSQAASMVGNYKHFRFSKRPYGQRAEVWMSETNFGRTAWVEQLEAQTGRSRHEADFEAMSHTMGAKAILRLMLFYHNKGLDVASLYAANDPYEGLELLPKSFFDALNANNNDLNTDVRAKIGPQMTSLKRVTQLLGSGTPLDVPRSLEVTGLVEHSPKLIYKGDGTAAHPDRFHRDNFAVLPYQLTDRKFALGYYVVTPNVLHDWRPELGLLDPARYIMPDQTFDLTLANIRGNGAVISVYDPLTGATLPAAVLAGAANTLTVRIPTSDYPRFLIVEESAGGPLITNPQVTLQPDGSAVVSFQTNLALNGTVNWGPVPARTGSGELNTPAGLSHQVTIPRLNEGEGVRITVADSATGIVAQWPRWGWDDRGRAGSSALPPFNDPLWNLPAGAASSPDGKRLTTDNRENPREIIVQSPRIDVLPGHTYEATLSLTWSDGAAPLFAIRRLGAWIFSTDANPTPQVTARFTVPLENRDPYHFEFWLRADAGTATFADFAVRDLGVLPEGPSGSVLINGGAAATNNPEVSLTLSAPGATDMRFQVAGGIWGAWEPYAASKTFLLEAPDGNKAISVQFRDANGTPGATASDEIVVDTIAPSAWAQPLEVFQSAATFDVPWDSSDAGGTGVSSVKLYYSTDAGATWSQYGDTFTTSPISFTAPAGEVTYHLAVSGADAAGNAEAAPSSGTGKEAITTVQLGVSSGVPARIPGLSLWFDAAAISGASDGQAIATWSDGSGQGRSAAQPDSTRQPVYKADAVGGKPAVRFDGIDDYMDFDGSFLANTEYTVIFVDRITNHKDHQWILGGGGEWFNANLHMGWHGSGGLAQNQWGNDWEVNVGPAPAGDIIVMSQNATERSIRHNGRLMGTNANTHLVSRNDQANLGWLRPIPGNTFYRGDIAEVIIYNRALSTDEIQQLEQYLTLKYAIPLSP